MKLPIWKRTAATKYLSQPLYAKLIIHEVNRTRKCDVTTIIIFQ